MDVLTDILGSLRLTGGVVIDADLHGDFCVRAQFTPAHCAPFFPTPDTLISYHYVRSGRMIVEVDGLAPAVVEAGGIAILPRNDPHLLSSKTGLQPANADDVSWITADGVHHVAQGTDGPKTEVWCGFLGTAKSSAHPLLDALPPMLVLDVADGQADWLDSSLRFVAEENPPPDVVAKLAELFLGQAIRDYVERLPGDAKGWLRGLTDPAVTKALSIIHNRFAEDLEVDLLAREAGVSRTVLGERFVELIGEPPMRYCGRWRMRMAANMLREGRDNTANIAFAVGFNSEAAFNRAFKREYGEPPATWRRRVEGEERAQLRERAAAVAFDIDNRVPADTELAWQQLADVSRGSPEAVALNECCPPPEPAPPPPRDDIRSCRSADGTEIAWASSGDGFPLVKAATWMTRLDTDWQNPVYRHLVAECSRAHRFVRADMRGFGQSQWDGPRIEFEKLVADLGAVIDAAGIDTCDLLGLSHASATAIAYAARNPDRVRRLVLINSYAVGWRTRADPEEIAYRESLLEMNRQRPSFRRSLLGEMFITLYFPSASNELIDWHNDHFKELGPVPSMERMIEVASYTDVRTELAKVRSPTLVCHGRLDGNAPLEAGRQVAEGISGARFVELDSANHMILGDEPAWPVLVEELRAFLAAP